MEFHLLLVSTGSVASIKIPLLIKKLAAQYGKVGYYDCMLYACVNTDLESLIFQNEQCVL